MVLTAENYYSQEANEEYMSVSQFKDFCGTYGKMPCEFTAMEKLKGRWEEPKSKEEIDLRKVVKRMRGARPWHPLLQALRKELEG